MSGSEETREYIRHQVIIAYERLGRYMLSTGDCNYGVAVSRRWLGVDALDEAAHRLLIQLLLESGNVRDAIAHYDDYEALLRTKLGVEPPVRIEEID